MSYAELVKSFFQSCNYNFSRPERTNMETLTGRIEKKFSPTGVQQGIIRVDVTGQNNMKFMVDFFEEDVSGTPILKASVIQFSNGSITARDVISVKQILGQDHVCYEKQISEGNSDGAYAKMLSTYLELAGFRVISEGYSNDTISRLAERLFGEKQGIGLHLEFNVQNESGIKYYFRLENININGEQVLRQCLTQMPDGETHYPTLACETLPASIERLKRLKEQSGQQDSIGEAEKLNRAQKQESAVLKKIELLKQAIAIVDNASKPTQEHLEKSGDMYFNLAIIYFNQFQINRKSGHIDEDYTVEFCGQDRNSCINITNNELAAKAKKYFIKAKEYYERALKKESSPTLEREIAEIERILYILN